MLAAHIGTRVTPMTSTFRPAASRSVTALSIDEGYGGSAVTVPVTRDDIFALLAVSRFGAYATTADGTVVFWNRRAEQILGTTAGQMLGRRESQTPGGGGSTSPPREPDDGQPLGSHTVSIRCASGEQRQLSVTMLTVTGHAEHAELRLYLFDEPIGHVQPQRHAVQVDAHGTSPNLTASSATVGEPGTTVAVPKLSAREIEILRLVAAGHSSDRIAGDLEISIHTVRNHVRSFRKKLEAKTKLDAVVNAIRLGVL